MSGFHSCLWSRIELSRRWKKLLCNMKRIFAIVALLSAGAVLADTVEGKVVKVCDGDTVHLLAGGEKSKIRLDRIDAPESRQEYGKEATKHLRDLIFEKTVRICYDKKDRYGRILGLIFLGEKDINLEMVATGHAWHYRQFDRTVAYSDAERDARRQKLGLWANPDPVNPQEWRKRNKRKRGEK